MKLSLVIEQLVLESLKYNNHLKTPVSVKGGKANKTSRLTKCNKFGPLTPVLN
ncbi:transcription factor E2FB, partial [Fagus crenata]